MLLRIANLKNIKNNKNYLAFVDFDNNYYLIEKIAKKLEINLEPDCLDTKKLKWLEPNCLETFQKIFNQTKKLKIPHEDDSNWRLCAPIEFPKKIIAVGRNYMDHVDEGKKIWRKRGVEIKLPKFPSAFAKFSSSITGPNDNINLPRGVKTLDYEIELAIVIGSNAHNVAEKEALNFVAGYMICNDLSIRKIQIEEMQTQIGISLAKNFPTFAPMGPWLTTKSLVENPQNLSLKLTVDGEIRQKANTQDMIFSISKLISYWSQTGLETGDIIITGTPSGVAIAREKPENYYLKSNQTIICEIEGLGSIINKVN